MKKVVSESNYRRGTLILKGVMEGKREIKKVHSPDEK